MAKTASVHYTGTSDVVEIDAASWKRVGVKDQEKVSWNPENDHAVPKADLNAKALEFLGSDASFKIDD